MAKKEEAQKTFERRTILKAIRDKKAEEDALNSQIWKARNAKETLLQKYRDLIKEDVIAILKTLEWKWPTKTGRRKCVATANLTSEIAKLLLPIGDYSACAYHKVHLSWHEGRSHGGLGKPILILSIAPCAARNLGLKRPGGRRDWSKMRVALEKAGITDEEKLAEMLAKKRGE